MISAKAQRYLTEYIFQVLSNYDFTEYLKNNFFLAYT